MGRDEEALVWFREALRQPNPGIRAQMFEAVTLALLDRIDEAREALRRVYAIKSDFDTAFIEATAKVMPPTIARRFIEGLRKAEMEK
jgi:Tfp pilus assembly protein PilF